MSRHLDGSPKPVDPLFYRWGWWVRASCGCGHAGLVSVAAAARRHGLARDERLYALIARMRCSACGCRPPASVALGASARGPFWT
jgi:hypothetical protein